MKKNLKTKLWLLIAVAALLTVSRVNSTPPFTPAFYERLYTADPFYLVPGVTGGRYKKFGNPAIGRSGIGASGFSPAPFIDNLAFQATLVTSNSVGITSTNNSGIWVRRGGLLELVARTGSPAPGTTTVFTKLGDPVLNNNGDVAFLGKAGTVKGIWSSSGGLVALVGDPAPGTSATFTAFLQFALPDNPFPFFFDNGVVMFAKTSDGAKGIWAVDDSGALQKIARTGDILSGYTNISALYFLPPNGQTRSFDQSTGNLIFRAKFTDGTSGIFPLLFRAPAEFF